MGQLELPVGIVEVEVVGEPAVDGDRVAAQSAELFFIREGHFHVCFGKINNP